jgi:addiction module RelE/StbE family toxin
MSYRLVLLKGAQRNLKKLSADLQPRAMRRIEALLEDPHPKDALPLAAALRGVWRVPFAEDWRIAYQVDESAKTVTIYAISHRHGIYDELKRRL